MTKGTRLMLTAMLMAPVAAPVAQAQNAQAQNAQAQNEKKELPLVPAQLVRPRGGLPNFFAKLKAGQDVRIAYFGGSITAAAGWRPKTMKWFQSTFPAAKISEINAAIGGTGSDLGAYRFAQDVLRHQPDLIFVEFAVNDGGASPQNIWRGMEGIVRQAWRADPTIDVCYVYTFREGYEKQLDQGVNPPAASAHEALAEHYGIASINVALRTAQLLREGKMVMRSKDNAGHELPVPAGAIVFSERDGVHPLDAAHEIYAQVVAEAMQQMQPLGRPGAHELKAPLQPDNWENAKLVPLSPAMLSAGWTKLPPESTFMKSFGHRLPEIRQASQPGEKITFRFKGTAARLYDIMGPDAGQVWITVDGVRREKPVARFDKYDFHRLASFTIADNLPDALHTVEIEVHPDQPDRSIITSDKQHQPNFDPKRYEGTVIRVGYIMLLGDPAP